jgi:hypothetical protein
LLRRLTFGHPTLKNLRALIIVLLPENAKRFFPGSE